MCTKMSLPSAIVMKPKPFTALKLLQVPEDAMAEEHDSDDQVSESQNKQKNNKTLQRITKNIQSYLNDPKPDKKKPCRVECHMTLTGHTDSVEDLCFKPNSEHILCSVGVDR